MTKKAASIRAELGYRKRLKLEKKLILEALSKINATDVSKLSYKDEEEVVESGVPHAQEDAESEESVEEEEEDVESGVPHAQEDAESEELEEEEEEDVESEYRMLKKMLNRRSQ